VRRAILAVVSATLALALSVPAAATPSRIVSFRTPSGNINCIYGDQPHYVRCDIRSGLRPKPPHPQNCDLEYGDSVSMNRASRAHLVCHGDTTIDPRARVVKYGKSITVGPFTCTSRTSGLTCRNAAGHGWFLSRESYRLF
jgi:hypothetical protein